MARCDDHLYVVLDGCQACMVSVGGMPVLPNPVVHRPAGTRYWVDCETCGGPTEPVPTLNYSHSRRGYLRVVNGVGAMRQRLEGPAALRVTTRRVTRMGRRTTEDHVWYEEPYRSVMVCSVCRTLGPYRAVRAKDTKQGDEADACDARCLNGKHMCSCHCYGACHGAQVCHGPAAHQAAKKAVGDMMAAGVMPGLVPARPGVV